ncbi:unnamed protein product [Ambrosiozyma monospora]|uniref:Unnamed protein product n=1 Tax=Ambrosiozyma monospora TaxID=43982 RepID=A0A9W6Z2Q0_AMBMO|nr:unnamed protein product [Ambrosiozyma monospora]
MSIVSKLAISTSQQTPDSRVKTQQDYEIIRLLINQVDANSTNLSPTNFIFIFNNNDENDYILQFGSLSLTSHSSMINDHPRPPTGLDSRLLSSRGQDSGVSQTERTRTGPRTQHKPLKTHDDQDDR